MDLQVHRPVRWWGGGRWFRRVSGINWRINYDFAWVSIPRWIIKVLMRSHEVVDGEVVFALEGPRAPSNDLLELDH